MTQRTKDGAREGTRRDFGRAANHFGGPDRFRNERWKASPPHTLLWGKQVLESPLVSINNILSPSQRGGLGSHKGPVNSLDIGNGRWRDVSLTAVRGSSQLARPEALLTTAQGNLQEKEMGPHAGLLWNTGVQVVGWRDHGGETRQLSGRRGQAGSENKIL